MEPERFSELAEIWRDRLNRITVDSGTNPLGDIRNLENHLRRAEAMLTLVTSNEQLLPAPLHEKIQSDPHAMFAIDEEGIVRDFNDAAERLYSIGPNCSAASLPFDSKSIGIILAEIRNLKNGADAKRISALIQATHTDTNCNVLISFGTWATASGRNLLLLKTVDFKWPARLTPLVQNAFGLTDAETAVMKLLTEGSNPNDIAESRRSSIATVRTQIRSIYVKTSTRNQNEFMRMALGLTTLELLDSYSVTGAYSIPHNQGPPPYPRDDDRFLLTLPDGRLMDYAVFGAPNGKPVLFMHSEFFGDGWPAEMVKHAIQNGLKIIAPARPHNGRSSPYPKGVQTYDQVADDTAYLLDHLGIEKVVLLSQVMAPSLFALMLAHHYPNRLKATVFLASLFPFGSEEDEKSMHFFHRFLSSIIHRSPRLLKFVAQAGLAYHNRVGTRRFFQKFAEGREADLAVLADETAYAAMAHGAVLVGMLGHEGYYNDYRCIPDNIEEKFLSINLPVTIIIGETLPKRSTDSLFRLISKKSNFDALPAKGGGQYIMYSHQKLIVDCLAHKWECDSAIRL